MGIKAKLEVIFILFVIGVIFLYYYDKPVFCDAFNSVINSSSISTFVGCVPHINPIIKVLTPEANAIKSSSPITITKVFVFGAGSTIENTTQSEFNNMFYNFSVQKTSQLNVLSNDYYVPTYVVIEETYYKSTSTSIGDYMPSLIGKKVYLSFIDANMKPPQNISAPYIVKSENIQGNEVIWNMSFDGDTSNATETLYNTTYSWINGIIFLNHTALISPRNPYIK